MPSEKVLERKKQEVKNLTERLSVAVTGVFADYRGLTVANDTELRIKCRAAKVDYVVAKNTLVLLAAKQVGLEALEPVLHGPTALATSLDDVISPAKVLIDFAKDNELLDIKGGFVNGEVVSVDKLKEIASIPPREVLLSRLLGSLLRPVTSLAIVMDALKKLREETVTSE